MNDYAVRQLAASVTLQAVKDYFNPSITRKKQATILKDLRSKWMRTLTEGQSVIIAEQLEKHPNEIAERLRQNKEI